MSVFQNPSRFSSDPADNTRRQYDNNRMSNYLLSNGDTITSPNIEFATRHASVMFSGSQTGGFSKNVVDENSKLLLQKQNDRPLEKLQLKQRMFLTVPYLGRGNTNTDVETQLIFGNTTHDFKSINMHSEKEMIDYHIIPGQTTYSVNQVVEEANNGLFRGGSLTN